MINLQPPYLACARSLLAVLSTILIASCASDRPGRGNHREMPFVKVSLDGSGEFFGAQLLVEAKVSNAPRHRPADSESQQNSSEARPDRMEGRSSGGGMGKGARGEGRGRQGDSGGMRGGMGSMGSNQPPLLLTISFQNKGTDSLAITVRDISSVLGNFVAQPETLTIAPGETASLEPMISRMGLVANELPLKLTLRAAGTTESQTLLLKGNSSPASNPPDIRE